MPHTDGNRAALEKARKARWQNKTPEEKDFTARYARACQMAKTRGEGLERCIRAQELLAYQLRRGFETDDMPRFFQASMHMLAWEKIRMLREKMEPQTAQYLPAPEEPTESVLSGVDQEELERLATSVPAYRGGTQSGHPPTQRPYKQRTLGMVTGIAEQDQKKAARRKEEAQIAANARPVHEEEE